MGIRVEKCADIYCVTETGEKINNVEYNAEKDLQLMDKYDGAFAIRFFKQKVYAFDGHTSRGETEKEDTWYFKGKKITIEQFKALYSKCENYSELLRKMNRACASELIVTEIHGKLYFFEHDDNDMTLEEYEQNQKGFSKKK